MTSRFDPGLRQEDRSGAGAEELAQRAYARLRSWDVPESEAARILYGTAYQMHYVATDMAEWALSKLLWSPMLRARCEQCGSGLHVTAAPEIEGDARISIGRNCTFSTFSLRAGRAAGRPELTFGDHCFISFQVRFTLFERISIGNHVLIAGSADIQDSGGYPTDLSLRGRGDEMEETDVAPVEIHDHAWIGRGAHVHKGVTIGRGAVVAAGSVVVNDVPEETIAMGVPARILKR